MTEKISRAAADQRSGRAGRTTEGACVRMWSQSDHEKRAAEETAEIHRIELSETLLSLVAFGCDPWKFPWFDNPLSESIKQAEQLLVDLGAIRENPCSITSIGILAMQGFYLRQEKTNVHRPCLSRSP